MTIRNRIWTVIGLLVLFSLINALASFYQGNSSGFALLSALIASTLGLLSAYYLSRAIGVPIRRIIHNLKQTLDGELTASIKITGNDEFTHVSREINHFTSELNNTLVNIDQHMEELLGHANHMTSTSLKSNLQAKTQQGSLNELLELATKLADSVNDVSKNAEVAASSATQADNLCSDGQQVISASVVGIKDMASDINQSLNSINELQQDCQGVALVLDVISGIADQTNLLALNAAIEAARAGEQGRGFAVVADEVRTLARRTQESTGEISKVISSLQTRADAAVGFMTEVHKKSEHVVGESTSVIQALNQITEKVTAITSMNQHIAAVAEQQKEMAQTIHQNVVTVNELSASTVEQTRETRRTGEETNKLAESVQKDLRQFKLGGRSSQ